MTSNDTRWIKSSYSGGQGGDCIEVAGSGSRVLVRDTKDRAGPVLTLSAASWHRFADRLKADAH